MRFSYVFMAVVLVGCGGGGGDGGPTGTGTGGNGSGNGPGSGTSTNPSATATVTMRATDDGYGSSSFSFNPSSVTITRGGSVTWTHDGAAATHNVTFSSSTSGTPANIGNLSGGNASRTFTTAGSFPYHCTNHQGMTGTVVVQ